MKKLWILILPLFVLTSCKVKTKAPVKKVVKTTKPVKVKGCTDKTAANYDSQAEIDNGSCYYNYITINDFVSAENIARLETGMSKNEVAATLNSTPFDLLHANETCEIYSYEYRHIDREFNMKDFTSKSMLVNGKEMYSPESKNLYVIFRDQKLESVITDDAKNQLESVICFKDNCDSENNYIACGGCTDSEAINFNPEANQDDGSCEYETMMVKGCDDNESLNYNMYSGAEFRVIKNDSKDTRKWEVVFVESGETMAYNDVSEAINTSSDDCEYCPCDEIVNPAYDPKRNCEAQCIPDPALADKYNYGCTDELAVNYDAEANKDDGSCVHCPCDTDDYFYVINKDRNCNGNPCIKVMKEEEKEEVKEVKEDCDLCDLLDFKIDFVPSMVAPMNLELDMKLKNLKNNE